uniref:Uncharacterized protein n=1 Tax=Tanacetum cinerariifolium TaxID=118510 RepID=A0A699HTD7_TANCI|nr:hypothetical protein [Tanacetum cinerariifolium]
MSVLGSLSNGAFRVYVFGNLLCTSSFCIEVICCSLGGVDSSFSGSSMLASTVSGSLLSIAGETGLVGSATYTCVESTPLVARESTNITLEPFGVSREFYISDSQTHMCGGCWSSGSGGGLWCGGSDSGSGGMMAAVVFRWWIRWWGRREVSAVVVMMVGAAG